MRLYQICVVFIVVLTIIVKPAVIHFVPHNQFEGLTVTAECRTKEILGGWSVTQGISLSFLVGDTESDEKYTMLAKYLYAQKRGILIPGTNRLIDVVFPPMNSDYRDSKMIIKLHNVRCEDSHYLSFCRLRVVMKGEQPGLTINGTIGVIPMPTKPYLTTSDNERHFVEKEENDNVTLTCTAHATGGLQIHWVRALPFFNTISNVFIKDFRAWQGKGERHKVCNKTLVFRYYSQVTLKFTPNQDFSEYYCIFFDNREKDLSSSEKISLAVKPKPVPATSEGILMPELHLLNQPVPNKPKTNVWYEGLKARLYCNHSIANIWAADVGKTIRLRLTFIQAQPGNANPVEQEIDMMYPYYPVKKNNSNSSVHPNSDFKLLGMNGTTEDGVSDATIRWTIHRADCVGNATYKCTVWYAGDPYKIFADHAKVQSSYQNIDFQCGLQFVKMMAYTYNGTLVPENTATPAQLLIMSCLSLGPRSVTWNITGHGYSIHEGNSTVKPGVKGIPHGPKFPDCMCFPHEFNFSVQVPVLQANEEFKVATCEVSIIGLGTKSISYVINRGKTDFRLPGFSWRYLLVILIIGTLFLVAFCYVVVLLFTRSSKSASLARSGEGEDATTESGSSLESLTSSGSSSEDVKQSISDVFKRLAKIDTYKAFRRNTSDTISSVGTTV